MEVKERELKDRGEKIKSETEELLMSEDDMDKFEEQEMKKTRPIKKNGMIG